MVQNIANIINDSIFTGEISEELRLVCQDYFCANLESDSDSQSEPTDEEYDILAAPLPNPQEEDVETIDIANIANFEVSFHLTNL